MPLITDPLTARVTDLFNVGYEILLQIFERFFAHTEETDAQLKTLADATIGLMLRVIKPLGDLITTLPAGRIYPGLTAGPSFELFYESDYLMPHREAAWALLAERLDEAAWLCERDSRSGRGTAPSPAALEPVLAAMREISRTLAAQLPAGTRARPAGRPAGPPGARPNSMRCSAGPRGRPGRCRRPRGPAAGPGRELADLFGSAHAIVARPPRPGLRAAQQALIVPRLVDSVLRPLADALAIAGPAARTPARRTADTERPGRPGRTSRGQPRPRAAGLVMDAAAAATELRARLGRPARARRSWPRRPPRCRTWPAARPAGRGAGRRWPSCGSCRPGCRRDPGRARTGRTW